jgi:hypothetical protein
MKSTNEFNHRNHISHCFVYPHPLPHNECNEHLVRVSGLLRILVRTGRVAIVLHHDAAPSMVRCGLLLSLILRARIQALHLVYAVYILRNFCQIHQPMLGTYCVNAHTRHMGKVFCATSLIRQGTIYDQFLQQLKPAILSVIEVVYEVPTREEFAYMSAICDLIVFDAGHRDGETFIPPPEYENAIDQLRRQFFIRNGKVYHLCLVGCCKRGSVDAAEFF